jgi:glucose 1-dehydrogenase
MLQADALHRARAQIDEARIKELENENAALRARLTPLAGRVVYITGAGSGIGKAIAVELARQGALVAVNDISSERAKSTADKIRSMFEGAKAMALVADVRDRNAVQANLDAVLERWKRIDVCVPNAWAGERRPFLDLEWASVEQTFSATFFGAFHAAQLAAQIMARQHAEGKMPVAGRPFKICFVSSVMADYPHLIPTSAPYNACKAAIDNLSRTMASDLAKHGICVTTVHPGWINTEGERQFTTTEEMKEKETALPFGLGSPQDVARTVAFVVGQGGDYMTGTTLTVDGGFGVAQRIPGLHSPIQGFRALTPVQ